PRCWRETRARTPSPSIPTVAPPPVSAPRCAAESTPRASPLTTTRPAEARSTANCSATDNAYGDPARDPTMATAGRLSDSTPPRVHNIAGGTADVAER